MDILVLSLLFSQKKKDTVTGLYLWTLEKYNYKNKRRKLKINVSSFGNTGNRVALVRVSDSVESEKI